MKNGTHGSTILPMEKMKNLGISLEMVGQNLKTHRYGGTLMINGPNTATLIGTPMNGTITMALTSPTTKPTMERHTNTTSFIRRLMVTLAITRYMRLTRNQASSNLCIDTNSSLENGGNIKPLLTMPNTLRKDFMNSTVVMVATSMKNTRPTNMVGYMTTRKRTTQLANGQESTHTVTMRVEATHVTSQTQRATVNIVTEMVNALTGQSLLLSYNDDETKPLLLNGTFLRVLFCY